MITVSRRAAPDPCGVGPLAAVLQVVFNNKPATGDRMPRRPWSDRSREGAVGSEETIMLDSNLPSVPRRDPWNKGRLIGRKRPLKPKDVWSIRVRLQVERRARNLALFNLAIDSKLRGCPQIGRHLPRWDGSLGFYAEPNEGIFFTIGKPDQRILTHVRDGPYPAGCAGVS